MIRVITCIFCLILFNSCNELEYKYYYLPSKQVVTRVSDKDKLTTYIVKGEVDSRNFKSYFIVKDKTLLNGFQALVGYKNQKLILIQPYDYFEVKGDSTDIVIQKMQETDFYKIFFNDTLYKDFIRIENN